MIGAVIEIHLHIYHRIPCQNTSSQGFLCPLLHCRNVLTRHAAAKDSFREGISFPCRLRADLQPDVAILAVAAALFLMLALHLHALADSFTVSHSGLGEFQLYAKLALQLFCQDFQMDFANATEKRFPGLLVLADNEGSIFLLLLGQGREHLVLLPFLGSRSGHFQHGLRVGN